MRADELPGAIAAFKGASARLFYPFPPPYDMKAGARGMILWGCWGLGA